MTLIVGLVHEGTVIIGGDSAGVAGLSLVQRNDRKVFRNGPFVFGFTSSFRMGQLLHWAFTPPHCPEGVDVERFMATTFVDALRACLKAGGYASEHSSQEWGGTFLVGYRGRLFTICGDYQVAENIHPYAAVGCGQDIALGALHAQEAFRAMFDSPHDRVRQALAAGEAFSAGVRAPFHLETLAPEV